MATLAERLSEALDDRGLTNAQLCELLDEQGFGVTPAYISGLCSGARKNPNLNLLRAMAALLDVSSGWLMGDDVPRERTTAQPLADIPSSEEVAADYAQLSPDSQRTIGQLMRMARRAETGRIRRSSSVHQYTPLGDGSDVAASPTHPFPAVQVEQLHRVRIEPGNLIGQRLRSLRVMAKLPETEAAATLETTEQTIQQIERGERTPTEDELERLLTRYGVRAEYRKLIFEVAHGEHEGAWWLDYFSTSPPWLATMLAGEANAGIIKGYYAEGVPPLLQTESYARAARQAAHHPDPAPDQVELAVRLIMERQIRPIEQQSAQLWFVLREAALLDMPGSVDIQEEQISHLIDMAKRPNIALRINRLHGGRYRPRGGSFTILQRFGAPLLVFAAGLVEDQLITDRDVMDEYLMAHIRLDMSAEPDERTVAALTEIRRKITA
ncbi:helix-turn-helix domain-containing protein [Nonomuraea sp. SYSU D8015]|uniref:helix-turn-helix domain-containing protein n=1 Tax=Nonomuraea sp. SYSU D8015 TaxID=2593644 RepID=UPI001CB6C6D6|nr:helix-turn-helix transcriptional regulator [Nonomuraea sp. SYSU D8015]